MKTLKNMIVAFGAASLLVLTAALPVGSANGPKDMAQIFAAEDGLWSTFVPDAEAVDGSWSQLTRSDGAVDVKIRSRVEPNHAVTLWWVIFNNPDACDGPCGGHDLFADVAAHRMGDWRFDQIEAAEISIVGGWGAVANPSGRLKLDATLPEGTPPGQILVGKNPTFPFPSAPGPVDGLTNAEGAHFLLILHDHGPAHDDPDLLAEQLNFLRGACNPEPADFTVIPPVEGSCEDIQFAHHR